MVSDYTIHDEIGRASNDQAFQSWYRSRSSHVFLQFFGAYMLDVNNHARWIIQPKVNVTNHKCSIGISSILILVWYFGICQSFSWYCSTPQCPPSKGQIEWKQNFGWPWSIWFVWQNQDFLAPQEQKLGTREHQDLLQYSPVHRRQGH